MKIEQFTLYRLCVPLTTPYRLSLGAIHAFDTALEMLAGNPMLAVEQPVKVPVLGRNERIRGQEGTDPARSAFDSRQGAGNGRRRRRVRARSCGAERLRNLRADRQDAQR